MIRFDPYRRVSRLVRLCLLGAGLLMTSLLSSGSAFADPADWRTGFHVDGVAGTVYDVVEGVDAAGPALFLVGEIHGVGDQALSDVDGGPARIVRFDGTTWSVIPAPPEFPDLPIVLAATVEESGGRVLYVATNFSPFVDERMLGRWDGTSWQVYGRADVDDMTVWDDGSGEQLAITGVVDVNGGGFFPYGAYLYDGSSWTLLGEVSSLFGARIEAVALDGQRLLVVMGNVTQIEPPGGPPVTDLHGIARWDGATWSGFGGGFPQTDPQVEDVAVFDDGAGPKLYAGGAFRRNQGSPASRVARWTGTEWEALAGGNPAGTVNDLVVVDGSGGSTLVGIGRFSALTDGRSTPQVAAWDGSGWAVFDGGADFIPAFFLARLRGVVFGGDLYVPMTIDPTTGGPLAGLARWTGDAWATVAPSSPPGQGVIAPLGTQIEEGAGDVYAWIEGYRVADLETVSGESRHLIRWTGTTWEPVPNSGLPADDEVLALAVYDDGSGAALYAGGTFVEGSAPDDARFLARLGAQGWEPVGASGNRIGGAVLDLAVYDDGTGAVLAVGGLFGVAGGDPAPGLAFWDGTTWTTPQPVLEDGPATVSATNLEVDGSRLLVAGKFTAAGGDTLNHIAAWNGTQWQAFDDGSQVGVANQARDMAFLRTASEELTCVLHGTDPSRVDCWNGSSWAEAPNAADGPFELREIELVERFGVPRLVGGGENFYSSIPRPLLLELDDGAWEPLGDVPTRVLGRVDDLLRIGDSLWVGGTFQRLADVAASGIGVVGPCLGSCAALFGDGFESGGTSGWSFTEGD